MPVTKNNKQSTSAITRSATIRFSHIDAAGIMFYPRYFELLSQAFPEFPVASAPFAMKTRFRKPNRLGDQLQIGFCEDEDRECWSFTGQMDGNEHFSVSAMPLGESQLAQDAHRPESTAFCAEVTSIEPWASDHSGCLQVSRFFELVNSAVEQWFEKLLDMPFHELHMVRGIGIPTVEMSTRCGELPRIGETVSLMIRPAHIGSRALTYKTWLVRDDRCLLENEQVIVFVKMTADGFEMITIPDDIRTRLNRQLEQSVA
ncbi:MAG: hypothetical protein QGF87_08120 [Woeseiaceae bacterium]|jgi:4-hydroxybenzoyl-CoA thioesterase|nr:hypothetical protein [Woeseiaceae bacterium]